MRKFSKCRNIGFLAALLCISSYQVGNTAGISKERANCYKGCSKDNNKCLFHASCSEKEVMDDKWKGKPNGSCEDSKRGPCDVSKKTCMSDCKSKYKD